MANVFYPKALEKFGAPGTLGTTSGTAIDLIDDTIKVALLDTDVTGFNAAHEFYSDLSSAVVGTPVTLASKTFTSGVFDAADSTFTAVTGNVCEALILYKDTGTASTSPLIGFIDTGTNLPVTPVGSDIDVTWPSGSNKIFKLG